MAIETAMKNLIYYSVGKTYTSDLWRVVIRYITKRKEANRKHLIQFRKRYIYAATSIHIPIILISSKVFKPHHITRAHTHT